MNRMPMKKEKSNDREIDIVRTMYLSFVDITYIINTNDCQKHSKRLVIPFHFVNNIWEWDEK